MIERAKDWGKRHWPRLRLRTVLFATLFTVAALPGFGAVFLRVYENTLVRQTEAELVSQGAALAATGAALWPGAPALATVATGDLRPEPPRIDLNATPILPERPRAVAGDAADPAASVAAGRLAPIVALTRRTTLADIQLLDRHGIVVAGPNRGASHAALPEVRAAANGRPDTVIRRNGSYRAVYRFEWLSRAAAIRVHHARPIVVAGRVVGVLLLSRSARALFRGMYEDRGKIAIGFLAILGTLVVLTAILSRGIARPIEALGAATKAVAAGRGSVPAVPATATIEIQDLYRDFATMAAAIDRRSRYLRDFAHAVSHEFKTPLAGIRGALELLRDHDATMAAADRRRFLANADADADRLVLLVTRLLDLARADMTPADPHAQTDLAPVVLRSADAARRDDVAIEVDVPASLPPTLVPAATIEAILATLLDNSRHAGARRIAITATRSGGTIVVDVADDGPGVAPGDRARIFDPFFTTRRAAGGSGLGLAIARSLLAAAGGGIDLRASPAGAAFVLALPIATPGAGRGRPPQH
ncbi:MAG TPA: HAMP domain-containing sensor histidine kinase [Sphingomonas sp.]|nr:HAMP domain-containing sensor histidine kinase [Sphingomonas sp.]